MTESTSTFQPRWAAPATGIAPPAPGAARAAISFAYGLPDPALFPTAALNTATDRVLREQSDRALQYGAGPGMPQLIRVLLDRLAGREGLHLDPGQCMITAGASQAIGLVARGLLDPGDTILLETPAWPGVLNTMRRYNVRLVPVPMDEAGLDIRAAEGALERLRAEGVQPKLLYTVPSFQNPTGITMSAARRRALLDLARRYDLLILEDDAYRDIAFDGTLPPSLLALDPDGRVLRAGTFSKILAAGLRLGWLLGPTAMLTRLVALKDDGGTSPFASFVTAAYAEDGALEPHIGVLVDAYRAKRDAMLAALRAYMPAGAHWTEPAGGFFIWLTLPAGVDAARLLPLAREQGVDFLPGRACFPDPADGTAYIRLSFSMPSPEDIDEGIKRLAALIAAPL